MMTMRPGFETFITAGLRWSFDVLHLLAEFFELFF